MKLANQEAIRVNFNVCPAQQHCHPLHLFISAESAKQLGVEDGEKTCVCSLRRADFEDEQFVCVRMMPHGEGGVPILADDPFDDGREVVEQKTIPLSCTQSFLSHYKIHSRETYYLRNVHAYPVQKLIVGVHNKETLLWTQKVKFGAGLIVSVCQENVLVRENDVFLGPYPAVFLDDPSFKTSYYSDMYILESSPVCQGVLTVNTEIIVILTDVVNADNTHLLFTSDILTQKPQSHLLDVCRSNLCISDFTIPLSLLKQNGGKVAGGNLQNVGPSCSQSERRLLPNAIKTGSKVSVKKPPGFILRPSVLPKHTLWSRLLLDMETVHRFDTLYIIGMPRPLMAKHGLFDGALVHVSSLEYQTEEQSITTDLACHRTEGRKDEDCGSDVDGAPNKPLMSNSHSRRKIPRNGTGTKRSVTLAKLAQVKMLKREFDTTKDVYVSPILMFNIHPTPSSLSSHLCSFQKLPHANFQPNTGSVSSSWDAKLRIAKEVQISLVNCPNYNPRSSFNEILGRHFQTPRTVAVGDVIAVRSEDDPEFVQSLSDDTETRHPVIYFKVIHIEPEIQDSPAFIVEYKTTTLIQVGSLHSYIPVRAEAYLLPGELVSYWEKSRLNGLQTYTDELESIILPHLTSRDCSSTEFHPAILLSGQPGCGKWSVIKSVARKFGLHVTKVNCNSVCGETPASTEARLKKIFDSGVTFSPCILMLQHIHVIGKDRDGNVEDARVAKNFQESVYSLLSSEHPVILVGTTASPQSISHDIRDSFLHHVTMEVPAESERAEMLQGLLVDTKYSSDVDIAYIAQRTAGFVLGDFVSLLSHVKKISIQRICVQCGVSSGGWEEDDLRSAGVVVQHTDFVQALDVLQSAHSDSIGAPKIPSVTWDDVGGLADVKEEILDTIQLPLRHPELLAAGLRRSGVMLYGPPGSGKTLLAKAVATECSLNFLSVKGPELINKYVGQSEENVREVFSRARDASPCVIFFDELDSLAPNRGRSGDSGGVMDRVVSQLLAELDGLHKSTDVFVIGATNRPDLLDPALLRPGRFDKPLYLGVSEDRSSQLKILKALTRKFSLSDDVDLEAVAEQCPLTLTGADFYALCSDAMLNSMKSKIDLLDMGMPVDQSTVTVAQEDFLSASRSLMPSVSEAELERYKQLKSSLTGKG